MRAAAPLALAALLLTACSGDPVADVRRGGEPAESVAAPSPAALSPAPSATTARALYWLGAADDPRGPRLYREFVRRPSGGEPVRDAVEAMLALEPQDPDYVSLWADGTTVREVRDEGTTTVVDLSGEALRSGGGSAFEAMTLQQLVHTVTAADPSQRAVRLLVEGRPTETLWGATDTSAPVTRAPAADTLGPVWLDVPQDGTVEGTFGGTATVFEATVSWQLRQGSRVVEEGFSTASVGAPGRGTWTATADVPPGEYQLWAYESSAEDGSVTWLDTKDVRVS